PARAGAEAQRADLLLPGAPRNPCADDLARRGGDSPPPLLNRYLAAALDAGQANAGRLVRDQGPALLEHLAGRLALDRLAARFLREPPADLLDHRGLLDFLAKLPRHDRL